ncbi:hypothetical protein BDW59DRAFT_145122 [Aspergillus cavernicola]|uniref:GPI-anchored cell wall organization protein Ecm33 n=1 Tax=Aspergillus cavernicola TaxID=176166 RepID=A0ABR4IF99_9EURO
MGVLAVLLLRVVLTIGALSIAARAQECSQRTNYTVSTQEEINAITHNCTEIVGELSLVDWAGVLTLHNITRLGSLSLYSGDITSLDLPDLEYFDSNLLLTNLPSLSRVSLPKLQSIDALHVGLTGDAPELHCPKLTNASSVFLRGNFASQSFDSLRTVTTKFDICNSINCNNYSYMNATTSMTLSFPVLEHVGNFKVGGNVTSLSTPEISAITCSDCDWAALHLKLYGSHPVVVDFPKLSAMEGNSYIRGDLASLSLPILREYHDEFTVVPHQSLDISLPVERADNFLFSGSVSSIQLPNLTEFTRIHINSDLSFDCNDFWDELKRTTGPLNESNADAYYQCSKGASYLGRLGVGVTAAIALLVTIMGFLT